MGRKNREDLQRGNDAKSILDSPLYQEAFSTVRSRLTEELLNTEYEEAGDRDGYYMAIKALGLIETYLESVMATGKFAKREF